MAVLLDHSCICILILEGNITFSTSVFAQRWWHYWNGGLGQNVHCTLILNPTHSMAKKMQLLSSTITLRLIFCVVGPSAKGLVS